MTFLFNQFNKFGVQPNHLKGETHLVDDSLPRTMPAGEEFKILNSIILAIAVFVVNGFFGKKFAAKMLGHNEPVFHNGVWPLSSTKNWDSHPNVSISFDMASVIPGFKSFLALFLKPFIFTLLIAKALFGVVGASIRSASHFALLPAIFTIKFIAIVRFKFLMIPRASSRTVFRVVSKFFHVSAMISGFIFKSISTMGARKFNHLYTRWASVDGLVSRYTIFRTKFSALSLMGFDKKFDVAIQAST